jgi:hypothetical protein
MDTVVKHGSHDQKTHGRGGGAREVSAKDGESAWDAVLTDEARAIDNRKKAHPERYDERGKLKDGEIETRVVRGDGPPRVRDYETNESAGLSWREAEQVEGAIGLGATGDFTVRVPVSEARPPQHVYRVMSTEEFDQARSNGYIKSDERMNLGSDEGTVTSLRSTGEFYAPVDGSDYRVVRIKYDDADGWRTDTDSYIKTQERVPFDRVDVYSSPIANPRVSKHGSHNQASHNPHKGGAKDLPEGWSKQSDEQRLANIRSSAEWLKDAKPERVDEYVEMMDVYDVYDGPNGSVMKVDKEVTFPAGSIEEQMGQVGALQEIAPVPGMTVYVSDKPFQGNNLPESTKGFVFVGESDIHLRPSAIIKGVDHDNGGLMPVFTSKPTLYSVTHEYGHTLDRRNARASERDLENVLSASGGSVISAGMRRYAFDGDARGAKGREAFAEAWTDWVATEGSSSRPFVRYYADKYGWSGGGSEPMSAGLAKQEARIILADTFTDEGAIAVEEIVSKAVYVAFEPGLRPVLKHGSHDQSSHGRRGGGGSSLTLDAGVAQSIVERVRANGGLSVSMVDGSEPTEGFMVAKGGKQSAIVDADEFYDPVKGPEAMSSFLKGNRELGDGAYLGLWHNQADGKVYLDVSENIMDRATAIAAGRERDQISIWDVANFEEIDTGGTGAVGKAVAGSETAGPVQDDRRGDRRVRKESVGEGGGPVVVAFEPGLRPVLKHGSHDQSSHGRRGGGSSAADELRSVPGQYTPPGGGTFTSNADTDEPSSRRGAGKTWQEEYEDQREAIAQALVTGDYSDLNLPDSPLARHLGSAMGRVERRITRIAERVGIKRKKRYQFTDEQATRMRDSYYERYGKPSWMGKAFKIVRKHLAGSHDQKSHGRGGGGGESGWGDRQKEIDAMASAGPSRYALETAVGGGMSDDEVRERIAEDFSESIEEQARDTVQESMDDEGWVDVTTLDESDPRYDPDGPLMGPTYQEEFESRMAQVREDITESYVYDYGDEYKNQAQADAGIDPDTFNEVYGVTHVGVTADGVEVTMTAQVENVYVDPYGDGIVVSGNVYDQDGNIATSDPWERKIYMENGELVAENALLRLEPEYRGLGFAKTFNTNAENYYISHGIDKVNVHAALDVGGYAWAKQGFDWAPKGGATWTVKGQFDDVLSDPSLPASVRRSGMDLRARLDLPNYDPDYPTPREVASWGYVQGASTWPGKQTLLGSDWYGQKSLTPSGPRQSTTQQEAAAAAAAAAAELPGQMTLPGVVS